MQHRLLHFPLTGRRKGCIMATEDRNGNLHSEKNGRFVAKGTSEAAKREEAERIYNSEGVPNEKQLVRIPLNFFGGLSERFDRPKEIPTEIEGFRDKRENTEHHVRHARDLGYLTRSGKPDVDAYERGAIDFFKNGKGDLYFSKATGDFYKFNGEKMVVVNKNGALKTFFKVTKKDFLKKIKQYLLEKYKGEIS